MSRSVKFGPVGPSFGVPVQALFEATQSFHKRGGAFVTAAASGQMGVTLAADTVIFGWWNVPGFSPGATEVTGDLFVTSGTAGTRYPGVIPGDPGLVFRMPTDEALTATHVGQNADIVVTTNQQFADLGTTTTDVLRVVGSQRLIDEGLSEALVQIDAAALQSDT